MTGANKKARERKNVEEYTGNIAGRIVDLVLILFKVKRLSWDYSGEY